MKRDYSVGGGTSLKNYEVGGRNKKTEKKYTERRILRRVPPLKFRQDYLAADHLAVCYLQHK
jgi:hypothetical protein